MKNATSKVQLAQTYNKYAEVGSQFGVVDKEDANIEQYVTNKALDGLLSDDCKRGSGYSQRPNWAGE